MGSSLSRIHNNADHITCYYLGGNGRVLPLDHCYCGDRARLPATYSCNEHRDVGCPLLLGIGIVVPKSRRPSLPVWVRLSVTHGSNGYEVIGLLLLRNY
jgi:hypothetical protein